MVNASLRTPYIERGKNIHSRHYVLLVELAYTTVSKTVLLSVRIRCRILIWDISSVGQSWRLITAWSGVQVPHVPPLLLLGQQARFKLLILLGLLAGARYDSVGESLFNSPLGLSLTLRIRIKEVNSCVSFVQRSIEGIAITSR